MNLKATAGILLAQATMLGAIAAPTVTALADEGDAKQFTVATVRWTDACGCFQIHVSFHSFNLLFCFMIIKKEALRQEIVQHVLSDSNVLYRWSDSYIHGSKKSWTD